ncbi:MAG: YciI family protein [Bacteroidota bacterium]
MKYIIVLMFTVLAVNFSANAQNESKPANTNPKTENRIKQFWFVMLLKGNNRTQDSATAVKLQEGHMANIKKLYSEGKLKVAGPFADDGNWRGVFVFDVATKEEVEQLLNSDPAIAAGRLSYEIHPWYTSPTGSFAPGKPEKVN